MRIALVTGATSGMGKELVKNIIKKEKDLDEIWLMGRRKERLRQWEKAFPEHRFRLFSVNLSQREEREEFYGILEEVKPQIAVFGHAAGFGIMGDIAGIETSEQEEMVEVNVQSCVSLTGHVLPLMDRGGRMIYFASSAAFLPQPGFAVYAASKSFVLSYVRSLRAENRYRKLRITAVCPGAVRTEFFDRALKQSTLPFYKQLVMADPVKVVKKAWRDNGRGREISVYGIFMKAFCLLTKVLPHRCFLYFMEERKEQ